MDTQGAKRVRLLAQIGFFWAALIILRLLQVQVVQHDKYLALAHQQQDKVLELRAARGAILDRTGQPLAMSLPVDSVCINPMQVRDLAVAADLLSKVLNLNHAELLAKMKLAYDDQRGFLWVKRKITPEESQRLRDLNLDGVEFRTESSRFYPNRELAAHVLGGVDSEEKGNAGIELALDDDLAGQPGSIRVTSDVRQRGFDSQVSAEPAPGRDIRLTIDSRIQFVAEQELAKAVEAHHCKTGSVVALNPRTGEVLALANYPAYDPNRRPKPGEDPYVRDNLAVTTPFEPGSVFKVITLSAALETTNLRPETIIPCGNGSITLFGRTIHDHNSYAALSMEDVLAHSSNIGAINIGLKVGDAHMFEYLRRFGFGHATGLPFHGESPGEVRPLRRWEKSSIASVAMGHEVGVTVVQLAQACSIIANNGILIRPRILAGSEMESPRRVLKPETAITMRRMMEGVVIKPYGTGHKYARILGYTSGGKTGTAQIFDHKLHEYTHQYNASFMGFAPVTNPAVVVVVSINGTSGTEGYGGPTSAPVFREVAAAALRILDVPKDLPDDGPAHDESTADENDLAIAGLGSSVPPPLVQAEDAGAADDRPVAPAKAALDQRIFSNPNPAPAQFGGPAVPDFQGKSKRDVIEQSAALGIPVEFAGSGVARAQSPPPGSPLPAGESVRVRFGR